MAHGVSLSVHTSATWCRVCARMRNRVHANNVWKRRGIWRSRCWPWLLAKISKSRLRVETFLRNFEEDLIGHQCCQWMEFLTVNLDVNLHSCITAGITAVITRVRAFTMYAIFYTYVRLSFLLSSLKVSRNSALRYTEHCIIKFLHRSN